MPVGARRKTPERGGESPAGTAPIDSPAFVGGALLAGRYRLTCAVGTRARVWRARDRDGRAIVVKTGPAALIEHEYRIVSGLAHPGIVTAIERIETAASPFIVFEALTGGDLVSLAGADPGHWLAPLAQLVDTLDYLHAAGFVHRDLKARHVMFDEAGRTRLIDFGSAMPIGSPWTAGGTTRVAVDPNRGAAPADAADDVYALAVLVHELIHGTPPGQPGRRSPPRVPPGRRSQRHLPLPHVPPPQVPRALDALLEDTFGPPHRHARPPLNRFATVIESLLRKAPGQDRARQDDE
jgi:serine/threonine protein kinase